MIQRGTATMWHQEDNGNNNNNNNSEASTTNTIYTRWTRNKHSGQPYYYRLFAVRASVVDIMVTRTTDSLLTCPVKRGEEGRNVHVRGKEGTSLVGRRPLCLLLPVRSCVYFSASFALSFPCFPSWRSIYITLDLFSIWIIALQYVLRIGNTSSPFVYFI